MVARAAGVFELRDGELASKITPARPGSGDYTDWLTDLRAGDDEELSFGGTR